MEFEIFPIRSDEDLRRALACLDKVWGSPQGSAEERYAMALVDLIGAYEDRHYEMGLPDPIEAILIRLEDLEMTREDLIPLIGSAEEVERILSRTLPFTLPMIRRLSKALGLPAEVLVQPTTPEEVVAAG
ncbi:MAG: transcriptional regulator [Alphaproteobacteria bacterium]|nr:transcriptional regulator [Alphaproteobacteria bacterium]MCB9794036.1 transcriptional regulator [Alphaproteobacteria bacterium]